MIHVARIELGNFLGHADTAVSLPASRVVLVQGENGHGKSALCEGVSQALWGESLRGGSVPLRSRARVVCRVGVHTLDVTRTTTAKGKRSVTWTLDGEAQTYDTTTKAQEAIERVVGPWHLWRRTSVMTSADAGAWALATDADRKRLLEAVLQLSAWDVAHAACAADLRLARIALSEAELQVARTEARLEQARRALDGVQPSIVLTPHALVELEQRAVHADDELQQLEHTLYRCDAELSVLRRQASVPTTQLASVTDGTCPTCGQLVEDKAAAARVASVLADADARQAQAAAALELVQDRAQTLRAQIADLRPSVVELLGRAAGAREARARHDEQQAARAELADLAGAYERAMDACDLASQRVDVLSSVSDVLGVRGARSRLLGDALAGLESMANAVLEVLDAEGMRITLRPYTENKRGSIADAIDLRIVGRGGVHYADLSTGQRRRVDVALVLALADVVSAARNAPPGTLWLDECADSLDEAGVCAFGALAQRMAENRAVIVTTHNPQLAASIPASLRWYCASGTVRVT